MPLPTACPSCRSRSALRPRLSRVPARPCRHVCHCVQNLRLVSSKALLSPCRSSSTWRATSATHPPRCATDQTASNCLKLPLVWCKNFLALCTSRCNHHVWTHECLPSLPLTFSCRSHAQFYGEITQQLLKNAAFPGSNNGTGLFQVSRKTPTVSAGGLFLDVLLTGSLGTAELPLHMLHSFVPGLCSPHVADRAVLP